MTHLDMVVQPNLRQKADSKRQRIYANRENEERMSVDEEGDGVDEGEDEDEDGEEEDEKYWWEDEDDGMPNWYLRSYLSPDDEDRKEPIDACPCRAHNLGDRSKQINLAGLSDVVELISVEIRGDGCPDLSKIWGIVDVHGIYGHILFDVKKSDATAPLPPSSSSAKLQLPLNRGPNSPEGCQMSEKYAIYVCLREKGTGKSLVYDELSGEAPCMYAELYFDGKLTPAASFSEDFRKCKANPYGLREEYLAYGPSRLPTPILAKWIVHPLALRAAIRMEVLFPADKGGSSDDCLKLYGEVTASSCRVKKLKTLLFHHQSEEGIQVTRLEPGIPLSRSVVGVSFLFSLRLQLSLHVVGRTPLPDVQEMLIFHAFPGKHEKTPLDLSTSELFNPDYAIEARKRFLKKKL
ncbi:unnamed protein product [Cuscuta epithymum]|uniref:Uncharacterized protein n=1 Tax=Cuscuta epithymum TaxID=186058 RepID=A0AAV0CIY6_9ASTE|nr:unnamed protein product [Cuscuta epithymum]